MLCFILTSRWRKGVHQYFMSSHLRSFFPTSGLFAFFRLSWLFLRNNTHCQKLHRLVTIADMTVFSILLWHLLQILLYLTDNFLFYSFASLKTFVLKCLTIWISQNSSAQPANQVALQPQSTRPPEKKYGNQKGEVNTNSNAGELIGSGFWFYIIETYVNKQVF